MKYQNTQTGTVLLLIIGIVLLGMGFIAFLAPAAPVLIGILLLIAVAYCFSSLTIQVESSKLNWYFGANFFKRSIRLEDIVSAKAAKSKWYYGLGIRLTTQGWLYNVSGLNTVKLTLKDNKTINLGTNDQANLIEAISNIKANIS